MIDARLGNPLYAVFAASDEDRRGRELQQHEQRAVPEDLRGRAARSPCARGSGTAGAGARAPRCRRTARRAAPPSTRASSPRSSPRAGGTRARRSRSPRRRSSATAPDEKPFSSRNSVSVPPDSRVAGEQLRVERHRADVADERAPEAVHDEAPQHDHVDVRGDREDASRLLHAAHVEQRDEHDQRRAPSATRCSARPENAGIEMIAATPAEIDTATVKHVVDHQRRARDERTRISLMFSLLTTYAPPPFGYAKITWRYETITIASSTATTTAIGTSVLRPTREARRADRHDEEDLLGRVRRRRRARRTRRPRARSSSRAAALPSGSWPADDQRRSRFNTPNMCPRLVPAQSFPCAAHPGACAVSVAGQVADAPRRSPSRPRLRAGRPARPRSPAPRGVTRRRDRRGARAARPPGP